MTLFRFALASAALCVSALGSAQIASADSRSVQLSKVMLTPDASLQQRVKVGTICLFSGEPLDFGASERTLNFERFEGVFAATMRQHGFNVLARSSNLFEGEGNSPGADFLIGGRIRPQSVDICDSVSGQKGSIGLSVEWQIYDRSSQQVVETVTTQGTGRVERFQRDGFNAMIDQAFSASLTALIEQGVVQRHLGSPAT